MFCKNWLLAIMLMVGFSACGGSDRVTGPTPPVDPPLPVGPTPTTPGWEVGPKFGIAKEVGYAFQLGTSPSGVVVYTSPKPDSALFVENVVTKELFVVAAPPSDRPNQDRFSPIGIRGAEISPNGRLATFDAQENMTAFVDVSDKNVVGHVYSNRECHNGNRGASLSNQYYWKGDGCGWVFRWTISDFRPAGPSNFIHKVPDDCGNARAIEQDPEGKVAFVVSSKGCTWMVNNSTGLSQTGWTRDAAMMADTSMQPAAIAFSEDGNFMAYVTGKHGVFNTVNTATAAYGEIQRLQLPFTGQSVGVCSGYVMFGAQNGGVYVYTRGGTPVFQIQVSSDRDGIIAVGCGSLGDFWASTHYGIYRLVKK